MHLTAKDIMVRDFDTIQQGESVIKAAKMIYSGKVRNTGYRTVSAIVADEFGNLTGVVSMFDILYHLRPPVLNYMPDSMNFDVMELQSFVKQFKNLTVSQVMSTPVHTVPPEASLMEVMDRLVKEKCRRLPVLEDGKVVGIVYLAEVYRHLCNAWLEIDTD